MADNERWNRLVEPNTLLRAWHIARAEASRDFAELPYALDVTARDLKDFILELSASLRSHKYRPCALYEIDVPKGALGLRPGSVIHVRDRVVANAIVLLIAPPLDLLLKPNVYSWRVKRPLPKAGSLFRETDLDEIPFLKARTIQKHIDPIQPWYALWPKFDIESRKAAVGATAKYRFMATSDIAAYFENIQIPLLREQLLAGLPTERRLINLLCALLESWVVRSDDGYTPERGIPQGSSIGSFLGNFFLHRLDEAVLRLGRKLDIKYFRYVDDVRVFAKSREDARLVVLTMIRALRMMHLNVQSAKTKILDESMGEVSNALIDSRSEALDDLREEIRKVYGKDAPIPAVPRAKYLRKLQSIAKERPKSAKGQPIIGATAPLEGLTSRVFRKWISIHLRLKSPAYIPRLLTEIERNPDDKLGHKLAITVRTFPMRRGIERRLMDFLDSKKNIFPYQEAQCLRALRYVSAPTDRVVNHCLKLVRRRSADPYARVQAAMFLTRIPLTRSALRTLNEVFKTSSDDHLRVSIAASLIQATPNRELVRRLVLSQNDHLRNLGVLFRSVKNDLALARREARFAISGSQICNRMPFLYLIASSDDPKVRRMFVKTVHRPMLGAIQSTSIRQALLKLRANVRAALP